MRMMMIVCVCNWHCLYCTLFAFGYNFLFASVVVLTVTYTFGRFDGHIAKEDRIILIT